MSTVQHESIKFPKKPVVERLLETQQKQNFRTIHWRLILMLGDTVLLLCFILLILTLASRFHLKLYISEYPFHSWELKLTFGCMILVSWHVIGHMIKTQDLSQASNYIFGPLSTLLTLFLVMCFWFAFTYPFIINGNTYIAIILYSLFPFSLIFCVWRLSFSIIINSQRFRHRIVIIGTNLRAQLIERELSKAVNMQVLGYIGNPTDEQGPQNAPPVLGDGSTLSRLIQSGLIDTIVLATDYSIHPELVQRAIESTQLGITVVPVNLLYENLTGRVQVEHIGDQWFTLLPLERIVSPLYLCWCKVVDILFGVVGIIALGLIIPVIAGLIYLNSPGPIFYKQQRLGYRGKPFTIYKFRSMTIDAEREGEAIWATKQDSRTTRIGRFLRATHLDELPQVFNILRGEMSLIGPRPERYEFVTDLETAIPFYRCRLSVKPGLTGWAQVSYSYGNTQRDALEKLQYDLYYIKHRSFMLDLLIIIGTVREVLCFRGT